MDIEDMAESQLQNVQAVPLTFAARKKYASPAKQQSAVIPMVLFVGSSLAFLISAMVISIRVPLWMDEVMASWMSQLPVKTIWLAISHGTISSPPTYFYLLKAVTSVFGYSDLALRMPSILAVYGIGLIAFLLMRRSYSLSTAVLAMTLCFATGLFSYATQVREYALMTLCFALAVFLWYPREGQTIATWRVVLITVLLATGVALHFYGVLLVAAFGLMELLWSWNNRRVRFALCGGIFVAGGSVFAWLPLMRQIIKYTGSYGASTEYYAKPTLSRLLSAYADLAFGMKGITLFSCLLCATAVAFYWAKLKGVSDSVVLHKDRPNTAISRNTNLEILILASIAVPSIVYVFAMAVTHTFNDRYAIAASFGFAMLLARLVSCFRFREAISYVVILAAMVLLAAAPRRAIADNDVYATKYLQSTADSVPIVVGEALAFFELHTQAEPRLLKRLVYLTVPKGQTSPDITNEDLLKRWQEFRPDLNVQAPEAFMKANPHFYVLHTSQSTDVITPFLTASGRLLAIWNKSILRDPRSINDRDNRNVWVFEVKPDNNDTLRSSQDPPAQSKASRMLHKEK